jgi:hypothetical protein
MSSMPMMDDRMVQLFRRTGKRRASYRTARSARLLGEVQRVVPQAGTACSFDGQFCLTPSGHPGKCVSGRCIATAFPGDRPFDL